LYLAIAAALAELGCATNVYHMREVGKNGHQKLWINGLDAKFAGDGTPLDRDVFDEILHEYDVSVEPQGPLD
jgi:hypothetical protein